MKRIGVIDFDTSHVSEFTKRLNHVAIAEDQWVEGAKVVVGCPGKSLIDPSVITREVGKMKELGVPLVETPEAMLEHNLDAVFIESNSGYGHLERVRFFASHKLPLFVDKPFACNSADAEEMVALAEKAGVPIFSSSSLRFAPEIVALQKSGKPQKPGFGCVTFGPAPTHPKNPGLFHYGIHSVEMLYAVMGPGCRSLVNIGNDDADVVTGVWHDGRIGTVRGQRPTTAYGVTTFTEGKVEYLAVGTRTIYRELLKAIVAMLETGKPPIAPSETIEIVRFIEKAADSTANHGLPRQM